MASEKLVRCFVSKEIDDGPSRSLRYVPLDVYQLWEFLMRARHHFEVSDRVTSLWFERGEATESSYSGLDVEPVTRVELFFYSEDDGMLHQKIRYFPSADAAGYASIRDTFLSHFRNAGMNKDKKLNFREHPGVWISR